MNCACFKNKLLFRFDTLKLPNDEQDTTLLDLWMLDEKRKYLSFLVVKLLYNSLFRVRPYNHS